MQYEIGHLIPKHSRLSANAYNRIADTTIRRGYSGFSKGLVDSTGFYTRKAKPLTKITLWRARTTEVAPSADHITCNLLDSDGIEVSSGEYGYEIEVYFDICGSPDELDAVLPRLADNDYLTVYEAYNNSGELTWYGIPPAQASINCDCNDSDDNIKYFGDPDTNGSWRIRHDGTELKFERRESGSWVEKGAFT